MKTITLLEPGQFERSETGEPTAAGPGQALVSVRRIGICGTDLHAFRGKQPFFSYPRILGHELGVEVIEAGENPDGIAAGQNCAVEPYLNCGTCSACRRGKTNCCESLEVLGVHTDGGMRERILVPTNKLHRSDKLELDQLALVETLGIGAHAVARAGITSDDCVLVIGAGPIGLSVVQFAKVAGAKVVLVELNEQRAAFCKQAFSIDETVILSDQLATDVRQACGGDLPTAVFDATGNPKSMHSAFDLVGHAAKLVFVGLFQGDVSFHDPSFHKKELTLLATRNALPEDFSRIISLMESGDVDTRPWITHRAKYDGLIEEFPSWLEPDTGVLKAMLEF